MRIEWMDGDIVLADVRFDIRGSPVSERVDFDTAFDAFDFADLRSRLTLLATQPGGPSVQLAQLAFERPDFADFAAEAAVFDGFVKEVGAVLRHHGLDFRLIGTND